MHKNFRKEDKKPNTKSKKQTLLLMIGDEMRQLSKSILLEEWLDTSFKTDGLLCRC